MRLLIGPRPKCDYASCTNAAKYHRPQLCGGHYAQLYAGQPLKPLGLTERSCQSCSATHYANGYCRNHYDQDRRRAKRIAEGRQKGVCCSSPDCTEVIYAKQLCFPHYRKEHRRQMGRCKAPGCDRGAQCRRLCNKHYKEYLAARPSLLLTKRAA